MKSRWVAGVTVAVVVLGACQGTSQDKRGSSVPSLGPSPRIQTARCEKPAPKEFRGITVRAVCPKSDHLEVGATRRLELSSLGTGICYDAPDFAGSFWLLSSRPPMLRQAGHGTWFKGEMERTSEERSRFRGRMIHEGEKHPIEFDFARVPGGWYPGGCD